MLARQQQASSFLYIQSDVPPGLELREWRRLGEEHPKGARRVLRLARRRRAMMRA